MIMFLNLSVAAIITFDACYELIYLVLIAF